MWVSYHTFHCNFPFYDFNTYNFIAKGQNIRLIAYLSIKAVNIKMKYCTAVWYFNRSPSILCQRQWKVFHHFWQLCVLLIDIEEILERHSKNFVKDLWNMFLFMIWHFSLIDLGLRSRIVVICLWKLISDYILNQKIINRESDQAFNQIITRDEIKKLNL